MRPVCVIDIVGLTPTHLGENTPRISALAEEGASSPLEGVFPAVTCTAQATILTGTPPSEHGIVGNGWLYRETGEVRFWQQSNRLIQSETFYHAAPDEEFTCAKLFWWFNQGAPVHFSVTPKPHYGADGSKVFGITGTPPDLAPSLEKTLGPFPFHNFWGPMAGLPATEWIGRAAVEVIRKHRPTLTLIYLPHLDYDLQRHGPDAECVPERLREVDECTGWIIDAARDAGMEVVILSEYGLLPVSRPVLPNRALREAGWLTVRDGPFGEMLDTFGSRAFAVADHQVAHVYVQDDSIRSKVMDRLGSLDGVGRVREKAIDHPRAGEVILEAAPDAWFAYPYWMDDVRAPDFARTVDIHRKPGYDPCELFLDPEIPFPRATVALRLLKKKMGLRAILDVVPLDPALVRGSHGILPDDPQKGPVIIATRPIAGAMPNRMVDIKEWLRGQVRPASAP